MRRAFFRLMLGDLNTILDGLTELEEKGIETIDCRRAQFSDKEPIIRLRMICQSWKVMFQAEYSSGSPLRMLVDLRASVEHALGRGKPAGGERKACRRRETGGRREAGCSGETRRHPRNQSPPSQLRGSASRRRPRPKRPLPPEARRAGAPKSAPKPATCEARGAESSGS